MRAPPARRSSGLKLQRNDAVLVRWGRGREAAFYDAVVLGQRKQARGVRVQFDGGNETAWVARKSVSAPSPSCKRARTHVRAHTQTGVLQ